MDLPAPPSIHSILAFLEYLYVNSISYKVILNYISSLKKAAIKYSWPSHIFSHRLIQEYLRSVSINSRFTPTPRGIFDISTLSLISQTCEILEDPPLFRAIFLLAFFGFLRMSNIAPHSRYKFDNNKHFLRQDIIFCPPWSSCPFEVDQDLATEHCSSLCSSTLIGQLEIVSSVGS